MSRNEISTIMSSGRKIISASIWGERKAPPITEARKFYKIKKINVYSKIEPTGMMKDVKVYIDMKNIDGYELERIIKLKFDSIRLFWFDFKKEKWNKISQMTKKKFFSLISRDEKTKIRDGMRTKKRWIKESRADIRTLKKDILNLENKIITLKATHKTMNDDLRSIRREIDKIRGHKNEMLNRKRKYDNIVREMIYKLESEYESIIKDERSYEKYVKSLPPKKRTDPFFLKNAPPFDRKRKKAIEAKLKELKEPLVKFEKDIEKLSKQIRDLLETSKTMQDEESVFRRKYIQRGYGFQKRIDAINESYYRGHIGFGERMNLLEEIKREREGMTISEMENSVKKKKRDIGHKEEDMKKYKEGYEKYAHRSWILDLRVK